MKSTTHANRGRSWEALIDVRHDAYMLARRAYVLRCHPKMRVIRGEGGHPLSIPVEAAGPDYLVIAQSRAFLIEAKQTAQGRWSFGNLTETQATHFDAAESHGAMGAVLLRFLASGRTFLVLWTSLGPLWWAWKKNGSKGASLTLEQAEALAVWSGRDADYLDALIDPLCLDASDELLAETAR